MCQGFIVPGTASAVYLRQFGIQEQRIFRAPNAVDNDLFVTGSSRARREAHKTRSRLGLPERYFLNVGRMVRAKGVFELLSAYAKLNVTLRASVGLVFVGEGDASSELAERAAQISPGNVQFRGFVQKEQLADYYALADALVFPTHSDTWGLVVNEAMACGVPVVASEVAGCVEDLVRDGWNGFVIPPYDVEKLSVAMSRLGVSDNLRLQMGERSVQKIRVYSPEACAAGIARAVAAACEMRQ
jgi:glycosyltransferase involved in cell wall biosynthesis